MQPKSRRWMMYALTVAVVMIPVAFAIGVWVKATSERWSAIGAVGQWASALLPLTALVFAYQQTKTANAQVVMTREALDDARKSAEEARLEASAPYLAAQFSGYSGNPGAYGHFDFEAVNLGNGPAIAVSATYTNAHGGEPRLLDTIAVLSVNRSHTFRVERPDPLPGRLTVKYYSRHGKDYSEMYECNEGEKGPLVSLHAHGKLILVSKK